jgi:hypothetical protein
VENENDMSTSREDLDSPILSTFRRKCGHRTQEFFNFALGGSE